jgi:hypothetical protein
MLHAAGVDWRGDGLVFTGPSGAGKSTLSGLFVDRGALILNDERIIVDGGETPVVHGTPWCGSNPVMNNARAPLRGLYFIGHGSGGHRLNSLSRARAAALCVRQAFMPDWDAAAVEATVASAERLSSMIRPLEYAFLKEPGAVDHLLDEASRHGKPLQARVS